jgi:cation:H+ antiporter
MTYLLLVAGLALLLVGGELLVRGSVAVARRLGLSEMLIGLTLVGFGTSVPELVTSLQALNVGSVGVAVGNVVGSNIANILLIIGLASVLCPIITRPREIARDMVMMMVATVILIALAWFDMFTRPAGIAMVVLLIAYVVTSVIRDRAGAPEGAMHEAEGEDVAAPQSLWIGLAFAIAGIAGVIYGANLLVENAVKLARIAGISETIIGLTIVAVGTSLPELVTSVMAALRKKADIALGNVIGSNIFNVLGILGLVSAIKPFSITTPIGGGGSLLTIGDLGMLLLSALLLVLFSVTGKRIARWEGFVLLAGYGLYMAFLFGLNT